MLATLTDQVLGEIPHMRYIDRFEVLEAPKEGAVHPPLSAARAFEGPGTGSVPRPGGLSGVLHRLSDGTRGGPGGRLAAGRVRRLHPLSPSPERVSAGRQRRGGRPPPGRRGGGLSPLSPGRLYRGGAVGRHPGLRDALAAALEETAGAGRLHTFLGGATGIHCGYLDFSGLDLDAVLQARPAFSGTAPCPGPAFTPSAGMRALSPSNGPRPGRTAPF